jgi:ketosteroid isomerase-like protein
MDPIDLASVRAWVDAWGAEVAAVDMATARRRFLPDVVAFGTFADVVVGLDQLHDQQWSQVWPTIEGFRFLTEEMEVMVAADRLMAVAVVGWASVGIAADGARFPRPGRATIVLTRPTVDDPWMGTHTHFSLGRGVPASSHGSPSDPT